MILLMTVLNRPMRFQLTLRSMTLDDREVRILSDFRGISQIWLKE